MSGTYSPTKSSLTALKVADLKALCVKASLPVTGTKAELINRLLSIKSTSASPAVNSSSPAPCPPPKSQPAPTAPSLAVPKPPQTAPIPSVKPPQPAIPNPTPPEKPTTRPSQTSLTTPYPHHSTSEPASVSKANDAINDESQNAIEVEIAKRAQRAQRFGLVGASEGSAGEEELKKLQRVKKFGGATTAQVKMDALDRALGDHGGDQSNSKSSSPVVPISGSATPLSKAEMEFEERKRKRAEKFGINVQPPVMVDNKKARV